MEKYTLLWNEATVGTVEKKPAQPWMLTYDTGWLLPLGCHMQETRLTELTKKKNDGQLYSELLPHMIQDLIPQGANLQAIISRTANRSSDPIDMVLENNEKFLSGFVISHNPDPTSSAIPMLQGRLLDFTRDGAFCGRAESVPEFSGDDKEKVNDVLADARSTQISGVQCKIPMHLDKKGVTSPALGKDFTHILKIPTDSFADPTSSQGALEWLGLELARAGGVTTVDFAMAEVGEKRNIGLLVERFDISAGYEDFRLIMTETLRSAMGQDDKFDGTFEDAGRAILKLSTERDEDVREYFRQVCAAFFGENNDFHLQNISLIEEVDSMKRSRYKNVRLAPAYDIMNGGFMQGDRVTLGTEVPPMALGLMRANRKSENVNLDDLVALAKALDIPADEGRAIAEETAKGMYKRALEIAETPPRLLTAEVHKDVLHNVLVACGRLCQIARTYFPDLDSNLKSAPKFRAP